MIDKKIKLWAGIGSYLMLSANAVAAAGTDGGAPVMMAGAYEAHGAKMEGGEGGEGGEAGYTNEDPDQLFAVTLMLTKGHILASRENAAIANWDYATAHAQHPAAETYDRLRPMLKEHGAVPFEEELDALIEQVIEKKSGAKLNAAYNAALTRIEAALASIEASKRTSPAFAMATVTALLRQAAAEYAIGVSGGKIVNLQEYQDAHGFIEAAGQIAAALSQTLPGMPEITTELAKLKTSWSATAVMDSQVAPEAEILAGISRIELKAGKIK